MRRKFAYLDVSDIEGGWSELYRDAPEWMEEIRKPRYEPLDKNEEYELMIIAKDGRGVEAQRAKDTIIRRNLRFVSNIARRYLHNEISADELISAGNEALVVAFDKFNHTRDPYVKFITYAVNLVRATMIEVLRDCSAIKLSAAAVQLLNDYITMGDLEAIKETFPERYPSSLEKLEAKLNKYLSIRYMGSLDEPINEDDESKGSVLPSNGGEAFAYGDEIKDLVKAAQLKPMEQAIIHLNFGLDNDPPMGLRAIAEKLESNLTAVSKIRNEALAKLGGNERLKEILEIVNEESESITWAHPTPYQSPE